MPVEVIKETAIPSREGSNVVEAVNTYLPNGKNREADLAPAFEQPEGGYGWIVAFTSMCCLGTVSGNLNTFGILYAAMLEEYGGGDPNIGFKTAWVGSVCTGLIFLMSMVAGTMSDRVGLRKVAFVGMLSSAFVEELMLYYLTYGFSWAWAFYVAGCLTWVGSVCTGLTFLMSMVAGILSDGVGLRKVAFAGGLLAFVGMLRSAFVEELMLYYLTYGLFLGLGFLSWVGSVCTGLTFLMSMVAGILSDFVGLRKVAFAGGLLAFVGMLSSAFVEELMLYYLTYGLFLGLGFALAYNPALVILGHYFKKRMGLVNGLVTFGGALSSVVYALVLPVLLEGIGFRNTLLCMSGLMALLMPCALTWKPLIVPETNLAVPTLSTEGAVVGNHSDCYHWTRKFLNVKIWRNRGYKVWVLANFVSLFGYFVPYVHLVQHTKDVFPESDGNLLPMCISITSCVSRIFFGLMSDCKCLSRIHMLQGAFLLLGVTTMCVPFANSFEALVVIVLVMGLCDGLFICLLGPIAFDLVGETGASQALGFLFSIISLPLTIGPPMAGLSYDYLGSYKIAFHAAGAPPIIGAILLFLIPRSKEATYVSVPVVSNGTNDRSVGLNVISADVTMTKGE